MTHTINGRLLRDCSDAELEREADAARRMQKAGWAGTYDKLAAIELEMRLRASVHQ